MTHKAVIREIEDMARRMRLNVVKMANATGTNSAHIGGALSMVDITATLYGSILRYRPSDPTWINRDRFILSKGHGVLGYYTALAEAGLIEERELAAFEQDGGSLFGHPIINKAKGIEFSNGSLGMGLSLGIGVAIAGLKRELDYNVYVMMGDGECNEGSVWESAMSAAHYELNNLIVIVDRNNFQQTGASDEVMSLGELGQKWSSFGWRVSEVDGHNIDELYDAFSRKNETIGPTALIANTIKGRGISFAENNNAWHHAAFSQSQFSDAMSQLETK